MDIFKILGFCLCALVLLSVLRQYNPGYAVLAALACCMVLLWFVMQALGLYFLLWKLFRSFQASSIWEPCSRPSPSR